MADFLRIKIRNTKIRFQESLKQYRHSVKSGRPDSFKRLYELITNHEILTAQLYSVRKAFDKNDVLRNQIEEYVAEVSYELIGFQKEDKNEQPHKQWLVNYRRVWRENIDLFVITLVIFVMSLIIGASVAIKYPDRISSILSLDLIENVLDKKKWFETIQDNPFLYGAQIAWNNIQVCLNCALMGVLLGIGGVLILIYNGLFIGAVYGFCMVNGFDNELLNFITSHGPLELTIIVASGFVSFLFGRSFFIRPFKKFKSTVYLCAQEAGLVLMGIIPWLCIAACLEVFISPWPVIPFSIKITLSLIAVIAFWGWTLRRV